MRSDLLHKVLGVWSTLARVLVMHANAIAFFGGLSLVGYGVAWWSVPAACVTLGSILMIAAAWPDPQPPKASR